jgi:hypothetical protein
MSFEADLLIYLTLGSLFLLLVVSEYNRLMPIIRYNKQQKKRYMNINDIRFEKLKLEREIEKAIADFEEATGGEVSIKAEREKERMRMPYEMPPIHYQLRIHIDVLF